MKKVRGCGLPGGRLANLVHSLDATPKGEAFQVWDVPTETEYGWWVGGAHTASPQARGRKVRRIMILPPRDP